MNNQSESWDMTSSLKYLASGVSIAACLLLPPNVSAEVAGAQSPASAQAVTRTADIPGEFSYTATPDGLRTQLLSNSRASLTAMPPPHDPDPPNLAVQLQEVSGLGVVPLHRIVGVSRQRFHVWLKRGGIGPDKVEHVQRLIIAFHQIRSILGPDLKGFVKSTTPAGTIEELLTRGRTDAVVGLALRPTRVPVAYNADRAAFRATSELPGWIQPVAPLNWGSTNPNDPAYISVLEELAPATEPEHLSSSGLSWRPRSVARVVYEA